MTAPGGPRSDGSEEGHARALLRRLPRRLHPPLREARRIASERNAGLWLVGGGPRDLLLGRAVRDVDLAVEGDAIGFARALARRWGARVFEHGRFGTASVGLPGGVRIDVAMTRSETYAAPGALPRVVPAGIEEDLARRDFTINALALTLSPGPPRLLDPHGGLRDLEEERIRMLHPRSPSDDPTRAYRAVRYARRLGLSIESPTRRWIREAVEAGAFEAVSGGRLLRELRLLLEEPGRAPTVALLERLGLGRAIETELRAGPGGVKRLARAERMATARPLGVSWFLYLLVWSSQLDADAAARLATRLSPPNPHRRILLGWPRRREAIAAGGTVRAPETTVDERLAAAVCAGPGAAMGPREVELSIRGRDLLDAGVPAGPAVGRALEATRRARRRGEIGAARELEFALGAARKGRS